MSVWIHVFPSCLRFFAFFFFFFPSVCMNNNHNRTVYAHGFTVQETKDTIYGTHGTIHPFKIYFTIMFSVFSFQFSISVK